MVFILSHLSGDPARLMVPPEATNEDIETLRHALGLDRPLHIQYLDFIVHAIQGDFGTSLWQKLPTTQLILERFPATLELALTAVILSIIVSIPLGIIAAVKKDSLQARSAMLFSVIGQSVPNFWLGIMMIYLFAVTLHWLPSSGRGTWQHLIMPAITLAIFPTARLSRLTRSSMLEVMNTPYIRTARAKGLSERVIIIRHGLKNAAIPLLTIVSLEIGALLGGAIIIETVFSWPGLGRLVVQAVFARDFPLVQAAVFFIATIFILINLVTDLLYAVIDPRIQYQ